MVGRGIVRIAKSQGITDIVEVTSKTCDLRNLQKTRELLLDTKPDVVIDAAAKVGGILANSTEPVDFMINNYLIEIKDNHIWHKNDIKSGKWQAKELAVNILVKNGEYKDFLFITPLNWLIQLDKIYLLVYR